MNRLFSLILDGIRTNGLGGLIRNDPSAWTGILTTVIGAIIERTLPGAPERMVDPETVMLEDDLANALTVPGDPQKMFADRREVLRFIGRRLLQLLAEYLEEEQQ